MMRSHRAAQRRAHPVHLFGITLGEPCISDLSIA
jgi:hypothetical protein